jgi:hypothetical protein
MSTKLPRVTKLVNKEVSFSSEVTVTPKWSLT